MKKLSMILLILVMAFLMSGCEIGDFLPFVTPDPEPEVVALSAEVEIINWVQEEGEIALTYKLTNTGTVDVAYYKILFKVTYEDESYYLVWYEKEGVLFAGNETVEIVILVSDPVGRVDVMDLKLTEWKFR